ncbi:MAG: hypothetical protein ACC655_05355, partial [Rhodothermia bacterium]
MRRFLIFIALSTAIPAGMTQMLQAQSFQGWSSIGLVGSKMRAISGDGRTMAGDVSHPNPPNGVSGRAAAYWTVDAGLNIIPDGGLYEDYSATGVSGDGKTMLLTGRTDIVDGAPVGANHLWTKESGLMSIDLPADAIGFPFMSSDAGTVVGTISDGVSITRAYRWSQESGTRLLGKVPGFTLSSNASDVSADGAVVVGAEINAPRSVIAVWQEGEAPMGLRMPGAAAGIGPSPIVSDNGDVIAGHYFRASNERLLFRWTKEGGTKTLPHPPIQSSNPQLKLATVPHGITADGSIIVGTTRNTSDPACGGSGPVAFIWTEARGTRLLKTALIEDYGFDISGWSLCNAGLISADGLVIVGGGRNPGGQAEGYRVVLAPEFIKELIVNDTRDLEDADAGDGVCDVDEGEPENQCTLRAAIQESNQQLGKQEITFELEAGDEVIRLQEALPVITYGVEIIADPGGDGRRGVRIDGGGLASDGFVFDGPESLLRGVSVSGFAGAGVVLRGAGGHTVDACFIGTDAYGGVALPNGAGVLIQAKDITVSLGIISGHDGATGGGSVTAAWAGAGVVIAGEAATGAIISGNYLGVRGGGVDALPNKVGVLIDGAPGALIGGTTAADRNTISGNTTHGVFVKGPGADGTRIQGNYI